MSVEFFLVEYFFNHFFVVKKIVWLQSSFIPCCNLSAAADHLPIHRYTFLAFDTRF